MLVEDICKVIRQKVQRKEFVQSEIRKLRKELVESKDKLNDLVEARETIRLCAEDIQNDNVEQLENLATLGTQAVFKRTYKLHLTPKKLLGKPVYNLTVSEGKRQYKDPKTDLGHSFLDVAGVSFRTGIFTMRKPTPRSFLYLDEPFRNIGNGLFAERAGILLRDLSHKLNIQILMSTHNKELFDIGDIVWELSLNEGVTEAEMISNKWVK